MSATWCFYAHNLYTDILLLYPTPVGMLLPT